MAKRKYSITDHAILRVLERCHGINIESLRNQISAHIEEQMPVPPDGRVVIRGADGINYIVVNKTLITVLER